MLHITDIATFGSTRQWDWCIDTRRGPNLLGTLRSTEEYGSFIGGISLCENIPTYF